MNSAKKRVQLSSTITILMMSLMLIHMFVVEIPLYTWIIAILGFPVIFIIGRHVHRGSYYSLKSLKPNMDVLVSLGSIPPYLIGLTGLFFPITKFIEMATTIMTFHLIGKFLESKAKGKASQAIKKLMELGAKTARILVDGNEIEVLTNELSVKDIMIIRPGEKIPTDGMIIEGKSLIDESIATGESMPVKKHVGDNVIGATINKDGLLKVEVTKVGKETFLSQVIEMVEACQGTKVPIQEFADRITSYFVPAIQSAWVIDILPKFIVEQMTLGSVVHHPTFLYEGLWNLSMLVTLIILKKKRLLKVGENLGLYLIWYGLGRGIIIEPMRVNGAYGDALMIMDIPVNIIMSLVFVALGVVYLFFSRLKMKNLPYQVDLVNVTS